uniref:Replication-associated protein n=1 Tax=Cressdnaviricota sp. TaxID=2748378 RepID=A0A890UPK3_9VIRU|nr:MAG: replication-associated protein [Cressdnaviricota sp.]
MRRHPSPQQSLAALCRYPPMTSQNTGALLSTTTMNQNVKVLSFNANTSFTTLSDGKSHQARVLLTCKDMSFSTPEGPCVRYELSTRVRIGANAVAHHNRIMTTVPNAQTIRNTVNFLLDEVVDATMTGLLLDSKPKRTNGIAPKRLRFEENGMTSPVTFSSSMETISEGSTLSACSTIVTATNSTGEPMSPLTTGITELQVPESPLRPGTKIPRHF